jgi:hypothetical protein
MKPPKGFVTPRRLLSIPFILVKKIGVSFYFD